VLLTVVSIVYTIQSLLLKLVLLLYVYLITCFFLDLKEIVLFLH